MKAIQTILILSSCLTAAIVNGQQNSIATCCDEKEKSQAIKNKTRLKAPVQYSMNITLLPSEPKEKSDKKTQASVTPKGMVLVPGGYTVIGNEKRPAESPLIFIEVKPFFMDEHPVTVAQFKEFIKATGYVTDAERFGNSGFIDSTSSNRWILKEGASWEYPQGKDYPPAPDNHPVTQVSWTDATAYCKWAGKRLPEEFEFEYAAKGASNSKTLYPWGNEIVVNGAYKANVWQGSFPDYNEVKDGFKFTSPVGHFGKNALGLSDMSGNVWQWCVNDKFSYSDLLEAASQKIFLKPTATEKTMRGGSFLCEPGWCHGYRLTGRSGSSPETSLMHVGFRCVKDIE